MSNKASDIIGKEGLYGDNVVPYLVEVKFTDEQERDGFLKVRETLTRIGIPSKTDGENTLYQTCHVLQKKGKYYIIHFKIGFVLDGRENKITEFDIARQNRVIQLLVDWGLITVVNPDMMSEPMANASSLKIVKNGDKENWKLVPKYTLGNKH